MSNFHNLVQHYAEIKFGKENEAATLKWVDYWTGTLSRNLEILRIFRSRIEIDFHSKTVLDIGCGTGGLSQIVTDEGGIYYGADFYPATLEMSQAFISDLGHPENAHLIQASGTHLPLADSSIDIIIAFDVIEHLVGGASWQLRFLKEIQRVLRPQGILVLTTPNFLHPFEGHTLLYGPQYLPVSLADRYIKWKNPSFLQEYRTYGEIHLLTPWKMKRLLDEVGLKLIYDFPWGVELEDFHFKKRTCLRFLIALGLGWAAPSCFWISACRVEDWEEARKLKRLKGKTG